MDANVQALHAALAASLMGKPAGGSGIRDADRANTVDPLAKLPTGKKMKLTAEQRREATFDALFNAERVALICEFVDLGIDAAAEQDSQRARMVNVFPRIFPSGKVSYNEWKVLGASLRAIDEYVYKVAVLAVKLLPKMNGALPSKDGGGKGGKRSASPAKWHASFLTALQGLRERMTKCPKADIDADALRSVVDALRALDLADRALAKRIAA